MLNLCEYGANVYELFGANYNEASLIDPKSTSSEDFVNALKLLQRQFGPFITQTTNTQLLNGYDTFLNKLNEFILPNVYRRMLIEFVKNIYTKIGTNQVLASFLANPNGATGTSRSSLDHVIKLTEHFENNFISN